MSIPLEMTIMGQRAKAAARLLARFDADKKNGALNHLADQLLHGSGEILEANQADVSDAKKQGLSPAMLDRLTLNMARLEGVVSDLRGVATLPDPVGEIFDEGRLPNGLQVHKRRVPLGVLGVIYEARPNVTIDIAGLALKTGNAVILRGGSETIGSNRAIARIIRTSLGECGFPEDGVQFVDDPDRARVMELLQLQDYVDMLIPRGGAALHQFCRENSRIPVITGGIGICHLFVDETADQDAALEVIRNAKIQRPTVCNALDTALVHRSVAAEFLPRLVEYLEMDGVTFRADLSAMPFLKRDSVASAGPEDFDTEWLSLVLGLKVVEGIDEAIEHITAHSTGHSDGILSRDRHNQMRFIDEVDSAAVYVNASTRFTDGAQLGLGAEVAISTQRLHARGPMALRELTTYKWVIVGDNHIRP
jgi:glutamate-5-semialdehyde dehydrogenase